MSDFIKSFASVHQWWSLAMFDIKQRYRRSTLGPLWITLSTGIMVVALGTLWSTLFKMDLSEFMPFFAAGLILWTFFSTQINEACTGYTQFEGYIKQINLPLPLYLLRVWARNIILMFHNMIVFLLVWAFFGFAWMPNIPMFIAGFVTLSLFVFFLSFPIAIICTRFRDITPIVQSVMQILYFFTPIMWQPKAVGTEHQWMLQYNPAHHLIDIVRAPLIGQSASLESWAWALGSLAVATLLAVLTHTRYRKNIAYWL